MQAEGKIIQLCHVTRDLDAALRHWTQDLKVGPFFVFDVPALPGQLYYGEPTEVAMRIGFGFSDGMFIELLQQTNDGRSPFRDFLEEKGEGLHHILLRGAFEESHARLSAKYKIAFSGTIPSGERVAIFDTRAANGSYIELLDFSESMLFGLQLMQQASAQWDGVTDPVRDMASLAPG